MTTKTTLSIAASARTVQLAIRAQLLRDVARLWPALDAKRLSETFPGWLQAMTALVRSYHGQSSVAAGASYRSAREIATQSPAPRSLIKLADAPDEEWMARAFGFSGPGTLQKDTASPSTALSTTLGTASRIMLDGGRTTTLETVLADPVAVGWYRVSDGNPCGFCAMLLSRGAVYKDHSFAASDVRFTGDGDFKVHNNCGCSLAPIFHRGQELPDLNQQAADVWAGIAKRAKAGEFDSVKQELAAFAKAWAERDAA